MSDEKVFPLIMKGKNAAEGPPAPNELRSIILKNGKNPPDRMQVQVKAPHLPNHAKISVKLPGEDEYEDLGDLPIVNGTVYLPVPFVFLCHTSEDAARVLEINAWLRKSGILTWLDNQDLLPGDDWQQKIEQAMESTDFVLVFLSPASIDKRGTFQRLFNLLLPAIQAAGMQIDAAVMLMGLGVEFH